MGNCHNSDDATASREGPPGATSGDTSKPRFVSQESNAALPNIRRGGRESVLDITGKPVSKTVDKSGKVAGTRLANIFMSPVQIEENYVYPKFEKTEEEKEIIKATIADNFIFGGVSKEEMVLLLDAFEMHVADVGTNIITEGEVGDYFYIIKGGRVEFTVQSELVGEAGPGKAFGDLALLYDCPRAATCVASEECTLFRVDQKTFRQILANGRLSGDREIIEVLRKVKILESLSDEYLAKIASATVTKTFKKGDYLIRKGDIGMEFFILKDGTVTVKDIEAGGQAYADQVYKEGEFFGERAIVMDEPRAANIIANEDCTTLTLSREDFLHSVGPLEALMKKANDLKVLKSVPIFASSDLEPMEYEELVSRIVEKSYSAGSNIYTQGEETEPAMFFVRSGNVAIKCENGKLDTDVSMGGYFGVTSTIFHKLPCASAMAIGDVELGILSRADIKAVIRTVSRLNQDPKKLEERASKVRKDREISLASLEKHRILGVGTFGKVWLVSRTYEGKIEAYALKIQRKRQLIKYNQVEGVIREIKVMLTLEHPFILSMLSLYQDDKTVMMLLNLVQGGELYGVMKKHKNMMLPERDSKFYASCILEGLHYMHYHSILYRDLKPENVLIDKDGYAVIVDLGFAKEVKGKTFTLCGTPWYIAPEVVLGRGHDKACDYWSWGILIHEMCTGDTPFKDHGADQMTLFKGIVKGKYRISNRASKEVEDLVRKILEIKPQYRLGNLAGGAKDIKTHEWLRDVNFNKLSKKVFRAPWTPTINDPLDVEAFDNWDHMEKDEREAPLTKQEQKLFVQLANL